MKPCVLYIPGPGQAAESVALGYCDAFRAIGWDAIVHRPTNKLEVTEIIEHSNVRMIFTSCRYGTRQLPLKIINANQIPVVAMALPMNARNETFGTLAIADDSDAMILGLVWKCLLHTNVEHTMWDRYYHRWIEMDMPMTHLPFAGNLVRATPQGLYKRPGIVMVQNFADRPDTLKTWVAPLVRRLNGNCFMNLHGDGAWAEIGMANVRPLVDGYRHIANYYAKTQVAPNFHRNTDRAGAGVNERTFMIPLCGGQQITDNPLATKYLSSTAQVAQSPSHMVWLIEQALGGTCPPPDGSHVAYHHTYFQRLTLIFNRLGMRDEMDSAEEVGHRLATKHLWEMQNQLEYSRV